MTNDVRQLVDVMLDKAEAEQPDVAHTITVTSANALFLPVDAMELPARDVEGPVRGHIYRNCLVWEEEFLDHVILVSPVVGRDFETRQPPAYYGDLRDGTIGPFPPTPDTE
ncbi:hypothetical protein GSU69_19675 (plasmid) [Rathayibacter festucae]|uniref:Uncharacterized protein n=1 Tax=Rathayibacter festucae TaxID=110937 RepID=A0ABX6H5X5_9MICO|nr:hypothetical protein [Rathayibacter festucae]QHC65075.1 hypothetical protein GSU69_19675 [Rathayibacter festucae]